jgi:diguanylate cyclase (GGDEF)-like protein
MNELDHPNPLFRVDLLTGCYNLVSFSKDLEDNFHNEKLKPVSLVVVDVYQLREVNQAKGFHHGDSVLRWLGIAIKDVTASNVYRISGDNFVAVMIGGTHKAHQAKAKKLFERLNREAAQLELKPPVVRMAVIHFPKGKAIKPAVAWRNINDKLPELIKRPASVKPYQVYEANVTEKDKATLEALQLMANRIENLGGALQYTFRLAYTDPISGAPNMLAIQRRLELELSDAIIENRHVCVCLIDGDNLKRYNDKGYEAGDDVIRKIHDTLGATLRPEDFIGRWRMGDEFVVILPSTNVEQAGMVAERLRKSIEKASKGWLYPISVSIGVAHHPKHGDTAEQLLEAAEGALHQAKAAGKNRVVIAV